MFRVIPVLFFLLTIFSLNAETVFVGFDTIYVDEEKALTELLPDSLHDRFVSVESLNEYVILSSETVTGAIHGTDVVEFFNSDAVKIASVSIRVFASVPLETFSVDADTLYMREGEVLQIPYSIVPENATYSNIEWRNSQPDIIDLSNDGGVTAKHFGLSKVDLIISPQNIQTSVFVSVYPKCNLLAPTINQNIQVCEGKNALFMASSPNIAWYNDAELTGLLGKGVLFSPNVTSEGIYRYYVVQEEGGCKSSPAEAVLEVIGLPNEPLQEEFFDVYESVDVSDEGYFSETMNWYQNNSLIYSGEGFPKNVKSGENKYTVTKQNQCESLPAEISFIYNDGELLNVKGFVHGDRVLCTVQIVDSESMVIVAEEENVDGQFSLQTPFKGEVLLRIVPNDDAYFTTYFGNTLFADESAGLTLDEMNIAGLDITLQKKTATHIFDRFSADIIDELYVYGLKGDLLGVYKNITANQLYVINKNLRKCVLVVKHNSVTDRFVSLY